MHIKPIKAGMALGGFFALVHAGWALVVGLGAGQALMDFFYGLHMVAPAPEVQAFNLGTALTLVIVTAVTGFLGGFVFARVWNSVGKSS